MAFISSSVTAGSTSGITTSAVVVSATQKNGREVLIQSDPANTTNVLVGSSTTQTIALTPGQSMTVPVFNLSLIYVKMASGTGTVNWFIRD